jgi:hypothetical protein
MTAPSPAGTQRRIRALFALGWFDTSIEAATGVPAGKLRRARLDRQSIRPDLAASVAGAYEALWNREPPRQTAGQQGEANAARAYARRWGWAPPMGWDDDLIDDPAYRPPAREWKRAGERHVSALALPRTWPSCASTGATATPLIPRWPCAWASRRSAWRRRWSGLSGTAAEQQRPEQNPNSKRARGARHDQCHDHHDRTSDRQDSPHPGWLARKQDGLSTRVHAAGDAAMAQAGLTVTASTGRFGFGARTYRHPGFGSRH